MTLFQTPESDEEGILAPQSPPLLPRDQGRLVLLLNWYPSVFRPKLRPCMQSARMCLAPLEDARDTFLLTACE